MQRDFNSSMVRLKGVIPIVSPSVSLTFQFLNGAIKSVTACLYRLIPERFQFLNGAIKSIHYISIPNYTVISIPQWCD